MLGLLLGLFMLAGDPPTETVATIPAQHHLIEGITSDGRQLWVSSVVDRRILRVGDAGRRIETIVLPAGSGAPLGIAWDAGRGWLWVTTACLDEPRVQGCSEGALMALDRHGRVARRLTQRTAFTPGDVTVAGDSVFVSDSKTGQVLRCTRRCLALAPVIRPPGRASAQGIVAMPDGGSIVIADYSRGIVHYDLATGTETLVTTADGKRLRGIDGLVRHGDWFIGVANFENPGRLVAFRIDAALKLVDPKTLLTGGTLPEPTQILIRDRRLLIVADAQWRHYTGATPPGPSAQRPTPILSVPLDALLGD